MINEARGAKIVQQRFKKLHENQVELFDDVEMYHQMYRAVMTESEAYPWDFQLVDPIVFYLLKNIMARLNPENMNIILDATNPQTAQLKEINQALVNWELSEMQKTLVFFRFIFRGLLAGRAYLSSGWKYEPAVTIKAGSDQNPVEKIMRDIVNRAEVKNVRFQDMFIPNHNVPDIEEQPYLIERVQMRYGDMILDNETQDREVWKVKYLKQIKEKRMFDRTVEYGIDLPQDDEVVSKKDKEDKWCYSQYLTLLKMTTKEGDVLYVPEKEKEWILNKDEGNPYWHGHYNYISWTPFPEDDDFFSLGIVQPIADLQVAASSALNQFLTTARKAANPMFIAGKEAASTPDWMFVNRPDGIIRVAGDPDMVRPIPGNNASDKSIDMRREIQTTFERTTGISSLYAAGVSGGSSPQMNKTATGARVVDANIDLNMQLLVSLFGAQGLCTIGEHFIELNTQYITDEQTFKLTGEEQFRTIKPEETTASFTVSARPDTVLKVNPAVKQASIQNFLITMDNLKNEKVNLKPIIKAAKDSYPEMDGIEDIIVDPEDDAQDAINGILNGVVPKVKYSQDHKAIITILQAFLLDTQEQLDDETLTKFAEYLDEHRKYETAQQQNLITAQPPAPQLQPVDEQALLDSMSGLENPTQDLPNAIPMEEMGGV